MGGLSAIGRSASARHAARLVGSTRWGRHVGGARVDRRAGRLRRRRRHLDHDARARHHEGSAVRLHAPRLPGGPRYRRPRPLRHHARAGPGRGLASATRRAPAMRCGSACREVQLGEPGWSFADLAASDRVSRVDALRPARVTVGRGVRRDGGDADRAFIAAIDRQVSASPTGEAVIYVPGYRVTFDQVMVLHGQLGPLPRALGGGRGVQLAHRDPGVELLPRLPARPRLHPRHRAPRGAGRGADPGPSPEPDRVQLRLAAPRRGARAARQRHPAEDHAALQRRYRIGNALFVAADIDLQTFARSHLPALSDVAVRTQVYVSEDDGALKWAARWRAPRVWDARTSTS